MSDFIYLILFIVYLQQPFNVFVLKSGHRTQLLGDSGVRAELQNGRLVSLLPPVGTEVFRRFSPASLGEIQQRHEAEEKEPKKKKKNKEVQNRSITSQLSITRNQYTEENNGDSSCITGSEF